MQSESEQLRQAIERTKRNLMKCSNEDFRQNADRFLKKLSIEYYQRDNTMEAYFLEFEEWIDSYNKTRKI